MKKITFLSTLVLLLCLFSGIRTAQAQCTVTITYTVGANGVVNFTGLGTPSTFTTNYYWYLPGSSNPSYQGQGSAFLNASATYTANGTYTVMFGMWSAAPLCSVNITQTISVGTGTTNPLPCNLIIQSTPPSPNLCNGSATVTGTGNLCGPVTYTWLPGLVNAPNISGLCQATTYTVYASSPAGVNCCSLAVGVVSMPTVNPCGLTANFTSSQGAAGLFNFNNTSSGTTGGSTYAWTFGDGGTSTSASGPHTYASNGSYLVTLTVNNNLNPACVSTKTAMVYVSSICNLTAAFTKSNITSNTIQFTNGTTGNFGPVGYTWNFGDGSPTSSATNPQHTYNTTGTFNVLLTANNYSINSGTCIDTAMMTVNITTICVANASFSLSPTGTPNFWNAFPIVPSNIIAASWYWGDGSTSNILYTSHTYSASGQYSICLSVTVSCGATAIFCMGANIYRPAQNSEDMGVVHVNVIDPSIDTGIKNGIGETLEYGIYPNPNNGSFNLRGLKDGPVSIGVYNLVGKMIFQAESTALNGSLTKDVQLDAVANGVYFIKINSGKQVTTKKIIVEHNK